MVGCFIHLVFSRFVALFVKEDDHAKIKQLIFTATIFLGLLFLAIATIVYPFADLILKSVLPVKYFSSGLSILPFSLGCLVLNALNGVFASVLDGMQKNYIRNIIFSVSSLLLLVLAYILVPKYHIKGVAIAQLLQSVFALFTCLILVIVYTKYNPLKWNWSKQIFKQIFSYGMKFQFISLANMLNEPITKILLGKFGGMAFAGYYEMANRLLMQARGVIISSTQSLVPVMINLSKNEIPAFYKKTFSNVLFFSMTIMACIVLSGRIVSFYWIGSYQPVFCTALLILSLSLFVNILNAPAYFYYMADGNLNILIKNHLLLGLLNALLSYLLGYWFGGFGVVFGWFIAILFSSLYLLLTFNKMYNLKLRGLFQYMDVISISFMFVLILISKFFKPSVDFRLFDGIFLLLTILYFTFIFLKFKIANYIQVQNKE